MNLDIIILHKTMIYGNYVYNSNSWIIESILFESAGLGYGKGETKYDNYYSGSNYSIYSFRLYISTKTVMKFEYYFYDANTKTLNFTLFSKFR